MIKKPQNTEQELVLVVKTKKKKKKKIPHRPRSVVRELIPCRPLSQRGWNPIKLAYELAGWPAQLATSAFNQLSQYANSKNKG